MTFTLYDYYRSSASYRVRIALNYKGIEYAQNSIHLVRDGGQQFSEQFKRINPQSLVPCLQHNDLVITQSVAIMEYLDEVIPNPPLLPEDRLGRARVRAITQMIACDIHPLNNRRVLQYFTNQWHIAEQLQKDWICHWISAGLTAIERTLQMGNYTADFCFGDTPTMADMCLVPQLFAANRFGCPVENYPLLLQINANCLELPYFKQAHPSLQPDAE
jgi:maleylacetoacetate isomerase